MGMEMGLIQVGGDDGLIAVSQEALGQFHADGVGLFRRHLAGGKGLDDMVALPLALLFAPAPLGGEHIGVDGLPVTVDSSFKTDLFRLIPVEGVVDSGLQRGLFPRFGHRQRSYPAGCGPRGSLCRPLQRVLYQPDGLPYQTRRLADFRSADLASGVGLVSQLVDIVADSRQFPQQGGVGVRGRGRSWTPRIRCRNKGSIFRPVASACCFRWAYSLAFRRRVMVL